MSLIIVLLLSVVGHGVHAVPTDEPSHPPDLSALGGGPDVISAELMSDPRPSWSPAASDTTEVRRLLSIAINLAEVGDYEEAEAFFRNAVAAGPHNVEALSGYADFLLRQQRVNESIERYAAALGVEPDNARLHNGMAAALSAAGRYDEALGFARTSVDLEPDYLDAQTNLGTLHARIGEIEEALDILEPAALMGRDQGNLSPILNLGLVYLEIGEWDKAIQMLGVVVTYNPSAPEMRLLLARAMLGKGDSISALAQINAGLKAQPDHEGLQTLKAEIEASK